MSPNLSRADPGQMENSPARTPTQPNTSRLARRIVVRLQEVGVRTIILFGSQVWGNPRPDSVLVVLEDTDDPQTSAEKGTFYRWVSRPLRDLQREWPLDLLVHTEGMHRDSGNAAAHSPARFWRRAQ